MTKKEYIRIPVYEGNILKNKNALITGGTSGIGFSIACSFLKNDCDNIIITSRNQKKLDDTISNLKNMFPDHSDRIHGCILDVQDISKIKDRFFEITDNLGEDTLDILVNNAGIYYGTRFGNVTEDEYDKLMDVNLKGQYFLSQYVSNYMIENEIQGNILNICSSSSFRPSIDPYMLSKLGMSGLTLGMAKKLISHGIVVNGIAPGPTATPMLKKKPGDDISHGGVPAGRYVMPEEIANLALFLVSDMGRMIVGDVIKITGGSAVTTYDDVTY